MPKWSSSCLLALIALACTWPLSGCGGDEDRGSGGPKTVASSGQEGSTGDAQAGTTQSSSSEGSTTQGAGGQEGAESQPPTGATPGTPAGPGETSQDQQPKKPHKSHSGGNSTAGLSPQEAAAYETARALCANPDSLQYAPEEIRDDAEALADFAERFAPPGEEQIVHDGCLVGLKSIGID